MPTKLSQAEERVVARLKEQAVSCKGRLFLLDKMLLSNLLWNDFEIIEILKQRGILISQGILCGNFGSILFLYEAFKNKGFEPTHGGETYCTYYELAPPD